MPRSDWHKIKIDAGWYANVDEVAVSGGYGALENCFITSADSIARFPGLKEYVTLGDNGRVYIGKWRGELVAATSNGRFYRIDRNRNVEDRTGVPITGGLRTVFSEGSDYLTMAAGGDIVYFDGNTTELLSPNAPKASFVANLDSYVIANEFGSGRWRHSVPGVPKQWEDLDVFAAESIADNILAIMRTDFRELLFLGGESIEQFERLGSGDPAFYRRWALGEGIYRPYLLVFADNATWTVNKDREFVRFTGQSSEPRSGAIGRQLESPLIDEEAWDGAWIGGYPNRPLHILGHKFILMQLPNATTPYGGEGLTLVYDYQYKRWFTLYGWDDEHSRPGRWPGWSHFTIDGTVYVGGEGKIYTLDESTYSNDGAAQRMFLRTANLAGMFERVDGFRLHVKRGVGTYTNEPKIRYRAIRDGMKTSRWIEKGLGVSGNNFRVVESGPFGMAHDWQFEVCVTDDCPVEIAGMSRLRTRIGA